MVSRALYGLSFALRRRDDGERACREGESEGRERGGGEGRKGSVCSPPWPLFFHLIFRFLFISLPMICFSRSYLLPFTLSKSR